MTYVPEDVWLYPLQKGEKLVTNDWIEWHFHSFLDSAFIAQMLFQDRRDVIATAVILWSASYRQDPAGTLPDDDIQLANLSGFGIDIARWQAMRDLVLWGWSPCLVEDPEVGEPIRDRLGHRKLIASIASKSAKRRDGRKAAREAGNLAMLKSRIRGHLEKMGRKKFAENADIVAQITNFLTRSVLYCTAENVAAALESIARIPRLVPKSGGPSEK